MSIVINGMNMPKGNSTKNVLIYSNGVVFTGHKNDANYFAEELKRGKWIVYKAPDEQHCGLVKCPFCGEDMIAEADEYNFCPCCGADMREGGEDAAD